MVSGELHCRCGRRFGAYEEDTFIITGLGAGGSAVIAKGLTAIRCPECGDFNTAGALLHRLGQRTARVLKPGA